MFTKSAFVIALISTVASLNAFAGPAKGKYIVVVGMASEAAVARGSNAIVITGAMRENQLRAKLAALDTEGAKGVISFGVAGGLDEKLKVGSMHIPDYVVFKGKTWESSPELSAQLRKSITAKGIAVHGGTLTGAATLDAGGKDWRKKLSDDTAAKVVDMESHIVAEFAASRGLPFAVVRVLSDTVGDVMPPAALEQLDENGEVQTGRVLGSIFSNPGQIGLLIKTGQNFKIARKVLTSARSALDSMFGAGN